jgi:hypothetical protein
MSLSWQRWLLALGVSALVGVVPARAQSSLSGDQLKIARLTGPVTIDGDLTEDAWRRAERVDRWYETNPGDNVEPKVKSVAYLGYDDKFFYAAFEFEDPRPKAIRAPLGDRDNVPSYTDYGGVILDTRNDRKSAILFLANPRGIQYDSVSDDVNGNEDSSPDFFWEAKGKIGERGWTLEIKIPFTSLRYGERDPKAWSIMLYRNRPREYRYQMFSTRLPRGGNCFICNSNSLGGLQGLPKGGHLVVAPYVNASDTRTAVNGVGTPLEGDGIEAAGIAIDHTREKLFRLLELPGVHQRGRIILLVFRFLPVFPQDLQLSNRVTGRNSQPRPECQLHALNADLFGIRQVGIAL